MRLTPVAVVVPALILLWLFPLVAFPHPGANDSLVLADAELPVLLLELGVLIVAGVLLRGAGATTARLALGVFLLGTALGLVIGLISFGNLSNDRFGPLLIMPVPIVLAGLIAVAVGVALSGRVWSEIVRGVILGVGAAALAAIWIELRGARDWLQAPYGFDIALLVGVLGVGLLRIVSNPVGPRVN